MNIIQKFLIAKNQFIIIYIPDYNKKINWYYEPGKKLQDFDEVTVRYHDKGKELTLSVDTIFAVAIEFKSALEKIIQGKLQLPSLIQLGQLSYLLNEYTHKLQQEEVSDRAKDPEDIFSCYWLWSTNNDIQTFLYNAKEKIFLEIGLSYPWHYQDPKDNEEFFTYEEFIRNYKPIIILEIEKQTIEEWIRQCNEIIQELNKTTIPIDKNDTH